MAIKTLYHLWGPAATGVSTWQRPGLGQALGRMGGMAPDPTDTEQPGGTSFLTEAPIKPEGELEFHVLGQAYTSDIFDLPFPASSGTALRAFSALLVQDLNGTLVSYKQENAKARSLKLRHELGGVITGTLGYAAKTPTYTTPASAPTVADAPEDASTCPWQYTVIAAPFAGFGVQNWEVNLDLGTDWEHSLDGGGTSGQKRLPDSIVESAGWKLSLSLTLRKELSPTTFGLLADSLVATGFQATCTLPNGGGGFVVKIDAAGLASGGDPPVTVGQQSGEAQYTFHFPTRPAGPIYGEETVSSQLLRVWHIAGGD